MRGAEWCSAVLDAWCSAAMDENHLAAAGTESAWLTLRIGYTLLYCSWPQHCSAVLGAWARSWVLATRYCSWPKHPTG